MTQAVEAVEGAEAVRPAEQLDNPAVQIHNAESDYAALQEGYFQEHAEVNQTSTVEFAWDRKFLHNRIRTSHQRQTNSRQHQLD